MKELFTISGKKLLFYNTILKSLKDCLKQVRAAELLGVSERHYRRLLKAYEEHGIEGLISKIAFYWKVKNLYCVYIFQYFLLSWIPL